MRKIIATALAAVTVGGALAATVTPASAQPRHYDGGRYDRRDRNNDSSTAIVAGIAGLAIGAALASSNNNSRPAYGYDRYPAQAYGPGYGQSSGYNSGYGRGQAYGGYASCERRERVYDPYLRRSVMVTTRYAC